MLDFHPLHSSTPKGGRVVTEARSKAWKLPQIGRRGKRGSEDGTPRSSEKSEHVADSGGCGPTCAICQAWVSRGRETGMCDWIIAIALVMYLTASGCIGTLYELHSA